MDFETARRNADQRLIQELVRIRNLPKRNRIQVATDKYGLRHASHTNAGLLKELEINLGVISREKKRVACECDKRQRDFRESQKKSLSKFLPPLDKNSNNNKQERRKSRQTKLFEKSTVWVNLPPMDKNPNNNKQERRKSRQTKLFEKSPVWVKGRKETLADVKQEMLSALTAKSKQKTSKIISENKEKASIGAFLTPMSNSVEIDENSWITRFNQRKINTNRKSCFPPLLEQTEPKVHWVNLPGNWDTQANISVIQIPRRKERTFRGIAYRKVLKMPDPLEISHLNPWDPKLYYVVMKVCERNRRKMFLLRKTDSEVAKRNSVFTKHWN